MPNQVVITIQKPWGATQEAEQQLQQDATRVQQACQLAANGSQRFRQAVKNIGPFIVHVERTAGIAFGVEGPPGGGVVDGTNAPGIGTSIDVGDHDRTTLHGGDQANRDAVRAITVLATLVHEIIGEELPGHDHVAINNAVIDVMNQLGIGITQLGECKAAQINGQTVQVFNWSVPKPGGPVVVQENITVANASGSRLEGCPSLAVGGAAAVPGLAGAPPDGERPPWVAISAIAAVALLMALGVMAGWRLRRAPGRRLLG